MKLYDKVIKDFKNSKIDILELLKGFENYINLNYEYIYRTYKDDIMQTIYDNRDVFYWYSIDGKHILYLQNGLIDIEKPRATKSVKREIVYNVYDILLQEYYEEIRYL